MRRCRLFLGVLLLVPGFGYGQLARLSGKVSLDIGWARKFYVCRMPGFDYMFTTSNALIIAQGDIDTAGNFSVNFPATKDESLYRLHFIRKGDSSVNAHHRQPMQDVNPCLLHCKAGYDQINFRKNTGPAHQCQSGIAGGSKANAGLNALLRLAANDTTGNSTFIAIADTSASQLVGLLAISRTDKLSDGQKEQVRDLLARYDAHNVYGKPHIFQEYRTTNYWKLYLAGGVLLVAALSLYGYLFYKRRAILKIWRELSQREMDIVGLILSGKSNKEVALALNIELSTVKTHVNNIYAKLGVNNRKDLDRYKDFIG